MDLIEKMLKLQRDCLSINKTPIVGGFDFTIVGRDCSRVLLGREMWPLAGSPSAISRGHFLD